MWWISQMAMSQSVIRFFFVTGLFWVLLHPPAAYGLTNNANAMRSKIPDRLSLPLQLQTQKRSKEVAAAQRLISQGSCNAAQAILKPLNHVAARLLKMRCFLEQQRLLEAQKELNKAYESQPDEDLIPLLQMEEAKMALMANDSFKAFKLFQAVLEEKHPSLKTSVRFLLDAALASDPQWLIAQKNVLEALSSGHEHNGRADFLEILAKAYESQQQIAQATATRTIAYLEEPAADSSPKSPPDNNILSNEQELQRLDRLLSSNRNYQALEHIEKLQEASRSFDSQALCLLYFDKGLAHRKVRHYPEAEEALTWIKQHCEDEELKRRAHYLLAKVVSIRDGLRAIALIEDFVQQNPNHKLSDDMLFWAGDMYQRRNLNAEAFAYYDRIEKLAVENDFCAEARFRKAWMLYKEKRLSEAANVFLQSTKMDRCIKSQFDTSRSSYWLGRLYETLGNKKQADIYYLNTWQQLPFGFYGQAVVARKLLDKNWSTQKEPVKSMLLPKLSQKKELCLYQLKKQKHFAKSYVFLQEGLLADAALALLTFEKGDDHSPSETPETKQENNLQANTSKNADTFLSGCNKRQGQLLYALLLYAAGAEREGHMRLRQDFADILSHQPNASEVIVWQAAYPLAFRDLISKAEKQFRLPSYALQALAREESAFDPLVVSWAEAYGLTQLLYSVAKSIASQSNLGGFLQQPHDLLDPGLNSQLGAALLAQLLGRFKNNLPLALAAYNAGPESVATWAKRFSGDDLMIYVEEIGIQETRGYVKRVLRSLGIYLWLYEQKVPSLPTQMQLPTF